MNSQSVRYLAAATFSLAAMSLSTPSGAGGLDLGGVVGGTLGALGGSSSSSGGSSGGLSAKAGLSIGNGIDAKANASINKTINAKVKVALYKKKLHAKLLVGKYGYNKHGKLAKVSAVIGTKPLHAKSKILLGDTAKAKVFASVGYKTKAKGNIALAGVGANLNVGLNLGSDSGNPGNIPDGGTPPGMSGSTPGALAAAFRDVSMHDQQILTRKCSTVLTAPGRFDTDLVALCRLIATR